MYMGTRPSSGSQRPFLFDFPPFARSTADSVSAISPASGGVAPAAERGGDLTLNRHPGRGKPAPSRGLACYRGRAPIAAPKAGGHIALFFLSFSISAFHIASESYPAFRTLSAHSCLMGTT